MPAAPPRRTLLLNASLEPLCVVSVHRAVVLVLTGKATVLGLCRVVPQEHPTISCRSFP